MKTSPSSFVRLGRAVARSLGLETFARASFHRLTRRSARSIVSETSKCRARLAPYCQGYGVDLGFGGDPILPSTIRIDQPQPYADYLGLHPVQLGGDVADLQWFRDGVLDYVYSSHVLEDFVDVDAVLREWLRVLKPGGRLVIYCPDEHIYRRHCQDTGHPYNSHHVHADFSLAFVQRVFLHLGGTHELHAAAHVEIYSWELVVEKIGISDPEAAK